MLLKPQTFLQGGKYKITRVLGQGGFGITYQAEQVALNRKVAIKEFFMKEYCERDETTSYVTLGATAGSKELVARFRTKFIREAQMIAGFEHPHIVKIYDVFEENGTAYYVMEYLEGESLSDRVKKQGAIPEEEALKYTRQVASALSYIHGRNGLHFDVKPSNILVNRAGDAILIDFGISKHYDEAGNQTSSTPVGISKGYAPMEQYQQSEISTFTPATDIYALGATLYTLLTGKVPPSASEVNEDGLPPFPANVPKILQIAVGKAMSPRRKDRPQTIEDFLSLLEATVDSEETVILSELASKKANHRTSTPLQSDKKKPKAWLWALLPVVVFAIILFGNIFNGRERALILFEKPMKWTIAVHDSITINGLRRYSVSFDSKRNDLQLSINKNFAEQWTSSQPPDWCSIFAGSTIITIVCEENTSTEDRTAEIYFSKKGSTIILASLVITQDGATPASSISMQSSRYIEAKIGDSFEIEYVIRPNSAKDHKVIWSSSDKTVASVGRDGVITAMGDGNTTISAKVDGVSAKCNLVVKIKQGISLNSSSMPANRQTTGEINGHEWVDLGLPSGLKWATCNVGASTPSDYGSYFAWGETKPKNEYTWENYKFRATGDSYGNVTLNKYNTESNRGTVDNKKRLEMSDDAARANWGGSWRIPTDGEWRELKDKCTWTWTTQGGKNGFKVTSKTNGNSIFLPAVGDRGGSGLYNAGSNGFFWSSSLETDSPLSAWSVYFGSNYIGRGSGLRCYGRSVRPITE